MTMTNAQAEQIARVIAWTDDLTLEEMGEGKRRMYLDCAQQCAEDLGIA